MADGSYSHISNFKEYIFFIVGIISMATYKFLSWIMPKTAEIFWKGLKQKIKEFQEANQTDIQLKMMAEISEIRKDLKKYKDEKHYIEGELEYAKDAIITNDFEKLEVIRQTYLNKIK